MYFDEVGSVRGPALDVLHGVVTIPAAAVQRGQAGMYVYLVKPDSTVALRPVEEKLEQDGIAVITKGQIVGPMCSDSTATSSGAIVSVVTGVEARRHAPRRTKPM